MFAKLRCGSGSTVKVLAADGQDRERGGYIAPKLFGCVRHLFKLYSQNADLFKDGLEMLVQAVAPAWTSLGSFLCFGLASEQLDTPRFHQIIQAVKKGLKDFHYQDLSIIMFIFVKRMKRSKRDKGCFTEGDRSLSKAKSVLILKEVSKSCALL